MLRMRRKPWLAGLLSFVVPGLGQFYAGRLGRGVLFFAVTWFTVAASLLAVIHISLPPWNSAFGLFVLLLPVFFVVVDAMLLASRPGAQGPPRGYDRWYIYLAITFAMLLIVQPGLSFVRRNLVAQAYQMPAGSMAPTLLIGDRFIVDRFSYYFGYPERGDVVIFGIPREPNRDLIKRVVGIPGDTVEIRAKQVLISGTLLREDYAVHDDASILSRDVDPRDNFGPITLSPGQFFVLGDNRDHSLDSRYLGPIQINAIKGKARTIFFSLEREAARVRWERVGMSIQ